MCHNIKWSQKHRSHMPTPPSPAQPCSNSSKMKSSVTFEQINRKEDGCFMFESHEMTEERLVTSLNFFEKLKGSPLLSYYQKTKSGLIVFVQEDDLRLARQFALLTMKVNHPKIEVEFLFPVMVRSLMYEKGKVFEIALLHLLKMLPCRFHCFRAPFKPVVLAQKVQIVRSLLVRLFSFLGLNLTSWKNDTFYIYRPLCTFFWTVFTRDKTVMVCVDKHWMKYHKNIKEYSDNFCEIECEALLKIFRLIIVNHDYDAFISIYKTALYPNTVSKRKIQKYKRRMNFMEIKRKGDVNNKYYASIYVSLTASLRKKDINRKSAAAIGLLHFLDYVFLGCGEKSTHEDILHQTIFFDCLEKMIHHDVLEELSIQIPCLNRTGFNDEGYSFPCVNGVESKVSKNKCMY